MKLLRGRGGALTYPLETTPFELLVFIGLGAVLFYLGSLIVDWAL